MRFCHVLFTAAVALLCITSCGEDSFLIRRGFKYDLEERQCLLVYHYDWTSLGQSPTGMTTRLEGRHTGVQTDLTNNVASNRFYVDADTFKLMTYNLSPDEFGSLLFTHIDSYDSIRVKVNPLQGHINQSWEGNMTYAQEPEMIGVALDTVVASPQNVQQGDTLERTVVVHSLVSTLQLKIHVNGLKNMRSMATSLTGLADGCYLSHPELPMDTCNIYIDNWTSSLDSDGNGWVMASVNCFGLPAQNRDIAHRDSTLNTLKLAFLLRDNTQRFFTFKVGDLFKYYDNREDKGNPVSRITLSLQLLIDVDLPKRTIVLPDVQDKNSCGFDAEVEPWEDGGNTDVTF